MTFSAIELDGYNANQIDFINAKAAQNPELNAQEIKAEFSHDLWLLSDEAETEDDGALDDEACARAFEGVAIIL